jgi:hypothetical protein
MISRWSETPSRIFVSQGYGHVFSAGKRNIKAGIEQRVENRFSRRHCEFPAVQ